MYIYWQGMILSYTENSVSVSDCIATGINLRTAVINDAYTLHFAFLNDVLLAIYNFNGDLYSRRQVVRSRAGQHGVQFHGITRVRLDVGINWRVAGVLVVRRSLRWV